MLLTRLLNACHHHPGFVYEHARLHEESKTIEVEVRPRRGSKPICSGCYRAYMLFLAHWARNSHGARLPAFHTSWDKVCQAVKYVVQWGLANRQLEPIRAIGVDEIAYGRGHQYLTLVYQIESTCTRLLWVGKERTAESFRGFFTTIGEKVAGKIEFVCSDMWPPYLQLIKEHCSQALNILDRFHIVAKMNKALDEVRASEAGRTDVHVRNVRTDLRSFDVSPRFQRVSRSVTTMLGRALRAIGRRWHISQGCSECGVCLTWRADTGDAVPAWSMHATSTNWLDKFLQAGEVGREPVILMNSGSPAGAGGSGSAPALWPAPLMQILSFQITCMTRWREVL
jgi:transposase